MKAAIATAASTPEYGAFAEPEARDGGAVIRIEAAALTNLDIAVAEGRHYLSPADRPFVIGKEAVATLASGERRYFPAGSLLHPFGSMAERSLGLVEQSLTVPDGVPAALAAAIGNAGLAAWLPLSWRARIQPGESVLVLGATGTSGLIAVAAARALGAGRIVAVGRDPERLERARALGADAVVRLGDGDDLAARYVAALGGQADIVVDYLNGPPAAAALHVMAIGGRMVQLSSTLSQSIEVPAMLARRQSLTVMGFAYYHAPHAEQEAAYAALCAAAMAGTVQLDHEEVPLDAFADAWCRQKAGSARRIVIMPNLA